MKRTTINEGTYKTQTSERTWFRLEPINREQLILTERSPVLILQQTVDFMEKTDILSGNYQWDSFTPSGDWYGRSIFTRFTSDQIYRKEILPSLYCNIPTDKEAIITLQHPEGESHVSPELLYLNPDDEPFQFLLFLDGQLFYETEAIGTNGIIWLPKLATGQIMLRITATADVDFYMNYNNSKLTDAFLKRTIYRFAEKRMSIEYEKISPEENLLFHWYAPFGYQKELQVIVSLNDEHTSSGTIQSDWSVTRRLYELTPNNEQKNLVLHADEKYVGGRQLFVFPLKQDISMGKYNIQFTAKEKPVGYLDFGRITPGKYEQRTVFSE